MQRGRRRAQRGQPSRSRSPSAPTSTPSTRSYTVPASFSAEATGPDGAAVSFSRDRAIDNVDGAITPVCVPASGDTFPLGPTLVTCTATDAALNVGGDSFTVTVVDTTAPVVTVPADITVPATSPSGAIVTYSATASDLVDGPLTPACDTASGALFVVGTTTVECSVADAATNVGSASVHDHRHRADPG